ncbi:serine carboxypeptidase [Candidatus Leptofilum sp.]|uniref:serine carboxypeptidase n=1 Tax=Candidatus Leptofilum sp. TaxID=3241576 RepID=UPI003B5AC9C3
MSEQADLNPKIAVLHYHGAEESEEQVELLGSAVHIHHIGCDGDLDKMAAQIEAQDGQVAAIALTGVAKTLRLGKARVAHPAAAPLFEVAQQTPVVDGAGVRAAMERWAVRLAAEAQPGIWSRKQVLMAPGLNHEGLAMALSQYTETVRYADPIVYFALPPVPGVGSAETLPRVAEPTLNQLRAYPFRRLFPKAGESVRPRSPKLFEWADILAGNVAGIRRYGPAQLKRKVVVTESVTEEDVADLRERGVSAIVTTMPPLDQELAHLGAAVFEAILVALRPDTTAALTENTYLNLMAQMEWKPGIKLLQPEEAGINKFAFVIHPLSPRFIYTHPKFRWARFFPDRLVERVAAHLPPMYGSRITGIESPTTGQKIEGYLLYIGGTPRELMRRDPAFVYRRLIRASRMAERFGARLMGLGAFTSVVGDAGITVAQKADIAITSGNSLTVAATLETAKQAVVKMGNSLDDAHQGKVMVIGATGSIGSVCSRLLAQAVPNIVLVAPRPEKLIALKQTIESETPNAQVTLSTTADDYVGDCDLIVTTTTALNTRIIDITKCKPGAVICDIARPPDITEEEAALRPDVLVIESGEILLPGKPDYGMDIGLPPGVAYACLAETALLALDGRFEDYTLGRNIEIERVKEIYRLYKKHGLELSGIRSHDHFLTDEDLAKKRALADELRNDPAKLADVQRQAAAALPVKGGRSKAKRGGNGRTTTILASAGAAVLAGVAALFFWRKK